MLLAGPASAQCPEADYIAAVQAAGFAVPEDRVDITVRKGYFACGLLNDHGYTQAQAVTAIMDHYQAPESFALVIIDAAQGTLC